MIREAQSNDTEQIVSIVMEFYEEGLKETGLSFDKETIAKTVEIILKDHIFLVADLGRIVGVIAGLVNHSIFDEKQIIAEEKIWYVKKEFRGSGVAKILFESFESKAKSLGASKIIMAHMSNIMPEKVKGIYKSTGYKDIESHYIKSVGG